MKMHQSFSFSREIPKRKIGGCGNSSVSEVLNIEAGETEETPNFRSRIKKNYIRGMTNTAGGI